jgi:hypothetical protein
MANLGGSGTQTAGLAFGGVIPPKAVLQQQQKNIMEQVGQQVQDWFKYSKKKFSRLWNTNSSFSFWW